VLSPIILTDAPSSTSKIRLEPALRIRPELRVWPLPFFAVTLSAGLDVALHTYDLAVDPNTTVGQTPRLWVDVALGLLFRVKSWKGSP
jgi:hypothetical protein